MKGMLFSLHTNKIFWKREKMLAFFYLCSLTLLLSSILLYCGESVKKASFLFCIKGGAFGILCLSIGLGFFIVWLQSIEERKEDFFVLRRIGTSKPALILSVQLEMLLFQFIAGAMAFASVSIQIYMYLRRNREQYQLYRMLGLSNGGIFVLWFGQHIVNLAITTIGFYSIMNYIEKKQFLGGKVTDENTIFFLALYVCVYSVLVGVVYRLATIQLNRKNLKGAC